MATADARERFEPVHDAHAIEQLIASIQFEQPHSDESMRAALDAMAQFEPDLPGVQDIRGVGFQIGLSGVVPIPPSSNGTIRFLTDGRGAIIKELRVERQSLAFRTQAYTRWDSVWAEAQRYFSVLLPVLGAVNVASFALQYIDKFIWVGDSSRCRPHTLIAPASPYISPQVLTSEDLWHCHSGQFRGVSGDVKRLEAIDVDCVDEVSDVRPVSQQTRRVVRIATAITDLFNQPGYERRELSSGAAVDAAAHSFPVLHSELKRVFSEIISHEYAVRVGMIPNDA